MEDVSSSAQLAFRVATEDDLEAIVQMLADDMLGQDREQVTSPLPVSYREAFTAIVRDRNNELLVACRGEGVVGALQLTYTPTLSHEGSWRATIEAVRTTRSLRGTGIGTRLIEWTIERARSRGCRLVQLTTNKNRSDARRFYERLGFIATHEGMKLDLGPHA